MNHQLDYEMEDFEEGFDVSLFQLPINGSCFRKTFYDPMHSVNKSIYCSADDIVVPYHTDPTQTPPRHTHRLMLTKDELKEREALGIFRNVTKGYGKDERELKEGTAMDSANMDMELIEAAKRTEGMEEPADKSDEPRLVLEQHRLWDLDGDGIREPYIFTVDKETERVLRIVSRTYHNEISGELLEVEYFTHYYFFPNPEGYYGLGFGHLLEGITEAASSVLNQIIDAGTLSTIGNLSGFYNKRSGVKGGDIEFAMGEFKGLDINTDDIDKAIYTFSFDGPSTVLFSVLGLLQEYSTRVTTVSESMTGELPSSDTPASLGLATIEQGLKVFSTIHRRIHRSFKKELKKLFVLNSIYGDNRKYMAVMGDHQLKLAEEAQIQIDVATDFANLVDIAPTSDPTILSRTEKKQMALNVLQLTKENPQTANNPEALYAAHVKYYKELGVEDIDSIYPPPPPPPDLPQQEENSMYFTEEYVHALPHQDHAGHIEELDAFMISPLAEELSGHGKNLAERHRGEHMKFLYLAQVGELERIIEEQGGNA
jgi:hypothetical protein